MYHVCRLQPMNRSNLMNLMNLMNLTPRAAYYSHPPFLRLLPLPRPLRPPRVLRVLRGLLEQGGVRRHGRRGRWCRGKVRRWGRDRPQ